MAGGGIFKLFLRLCDYRDVEDNILTKVDRRFW